MGLVMSVLKEAAPKLVQTSVQLLTRYVGTRLLTAPRTGEDEISEIMREVDAELTSLDINSMLNEREMLADNETDRMMQMLDAAETLVKKGDSENGRAQLREALNNTGCNRCKKGLEQIISEDDNRALISKIGILKQLVPSYMTVLETEPKLAMKGSVDQGEGDGGKPCLPCIARAISTICDGDRACIEAATTIQKENPNADTSIIIKRITEFAATNHR